MLISWSVKTQLIRYSLKSMLFWKKTTQPVTFWSYKVLFQVSHQKEPACPSKSICVLFTHPEPVSLEPTSVLTVTRTWGQSSQLHFGPQLALQWPFSQWLCTELGWNFNLNTAWRAWTPTFLLSDVQLTAKDVFKAVGITWGSNGQMFTYWALATAYLLINSDFACWEHANSEMHP